MITEIAIAIASYSLCCYIYDTNERKFKNKFNDSVQNLGLFNKSGDTYKVKKYETRKYGCYASISIPPGLSFELLTSKINTLQDNLNGLIIMDKNPFTSYINFYFISSDVTKYVYSPVKCKNNQLFIGKDIKGSIVRMDLNTNPHLLISGATGTGKSFFISTILANTCYYHSLDVELWLMQTVKGELSNFADCSNVRCCARTLLQVQAYLNKLIQIMQYRSNKFEEHGIKNISQWNSHFSNHKMHRILVVTEEMYSFAEICYPQLSQIAKAGRSVGIHLIGLVQRTTIANIPSDIKAQMSRITFRQKSDIDSVNVIGNKNAVDLKDRECILDSSEGQQKVIVPFVDEDYAILNKYVPEIHIPSDNVYEKTDMKEISDYIQPHEENIVDVKYKETSDPQPVKKRKRKGIVSIEDIHDN